MEERFFGRERLRSVEEWIAQIEFRWKNIPEFKVDPEKLKHLAIICDGDRHSAQAKGLPPHEGHRLGLEVIKGIARAGREWDIQALTFWVWSTENWQRDLQQVDFIMSLAAKSLKNENLIQEFVENKVRFTHLGRKDRLPEEVKKGIESLEVRTANFGRYYFNVAMDYGGLDEIARSMIRIFEDISTGNLDKRKILENPETILDFLDTTSQPLPDLVVRTGMVPGEVVHTSGFLPLQTRYAGWTFVSEYFPDLKPETLLGSIKEFIKYERRLGR